MDPAALQRSPLFALLPAEVVAAVAAAMTTRRLVSGDRLWHEGQTADELAFVVSGALVVRVGAQDVGAIRPDELVGETSTFFAEPRIASVVATETTGLALLSRDALLALRDRQPAAYDVLLDRALEAMARRVQEAGRRVAKLGSGGVEPPVRKAPGMLSRLLRAGVADAPSTPVLPTLRKLPVLSRAAPALLTQIAAAMTARRLQVDEVLILEGEPGDSAFVIGEGEIEVLRAVRGGRARRLATVTEGAVIGTGSLLLGERRNASVKVTRAGWAWELTRPGHVRIGGSEAGRAWREALLTSLRQQLMQVVGSVADLQGGTSAADRARLAEAQDRLAAVRADAEVDDPWTFRGRVRD